MTVQNQLVQWDIVIEQVHTPDDWDMLSVEDWDRLMGFKSQKSGPQHKLMAEHETEEQPAMMVDPFKFFVQSLDKDQLMEITEGEWRELFGDRTPSQIKEILDQFDYETILHVANVFSEEEIGSFMESLTEQEWEETTPDQWRAMVVGFSSQDFKEILDEMTDEQIMDVWECFEPWMSDKFFDNLRREDIEDFTLGEWKATMHLPVEEVKARFFDHMTTEEILELAAMIDDDEDLMGQFLRNLSRELYQQFTPEEWEALFFGLDNPEDIVDFA